MSNNNPFLSEDQKINIKRTMPNGTQIAGKVEIHTMKKDLENNASGFEQPETSYLPQKTDTTKITDNKEKQKSGPFLSPAYDETRTPISNVATNNSPAKTVLMAGIIVFSVLAIALGGYYYWITRTGTTEEIAQVETIVPNNTNENIEAPAIETPVAVPEQSAATEINATKPNYLIVDIDRLDTTKIKEIVEDHAKRAAELNSPKPVEFIVTDSQNNPITFSKFAEKLGISLSTSVLSYLENNFTILSYKEKNQPHLGMIIDMKNGNESSKLKDAMLQEEPNLQKNIQPMFLIPSSTYASQKYSTSTYGGAAIRYINITTPDELSVDYTIYKNKLIIGTTKKTIYSLIDKLNPTATAN